MKNINYALSKQMRIRLIQEEVLLNKVYNNLVKIGYNIDGARIALINKAVKT